MPGDLVFYDGGCALCHWAVRFFINRDRPGRIRYAPLDGRTFEQRLTPTERSHLPDSLVVLTEGGDLLVRSAAVLYLMRVIGGVWRPLGWLGGVVPKPLADAMYNAIARSRRRWFGKPRTACPMTPPELRSRFDP
ncbi:MAG: thiol-disulfide oxidoreductase DCC family protein [Bryobacteraceae bacterium]